MTEREVENALNRCASFLSDRAREVHVLARSGRDREESLEEAGMTPESIVELLSSTLERFLD